LDRYLARYVFVIVDEFYGAELHGDIATKHCHHSAAWPEREMATIIYGKLAKRRRRLVTAWFLAKLFFRAFNCGSVWSRTRAGYLDNAETIANHGDI
jgi:hypothetical protein